MRGLSQGIHDNKNATIFIHIEIHSGQHVLDLTAISYKINAAHTKHPRDEERDSEGRTCVYFNRGVMSCMGGGGEKTREKGLCPDNPTDSIRSLLAEI